MRLNARALPASCLLVGFCLIALGFAWAASGSSHPTLVAPDSAKTGDEIVVDATSDSGGLRIVVTDATGAVIYDSDEDASAEETEETSPDGVQCKNSTVIFTVPSTAVGPLNVVATDASGGMTSKSITLTN